MASPRFGVGFRSAHFADVLARPDAVDWLEVLVDGYLGVGGPRRAMLERLRAVRPIALHGVGLSIAGEEPFRGPYLRGLAELARWLEPVAVSDHLCWTSLGRRTAHDLLPVAYTRAVLEHVAARVGRVQDVLGRRLLLENPTAYVAFRDADMDEAEFLAALAARTGCGVLLDVNNLLVNAANLGVDPARWLATLPRDAVGYLHLAGHAVLPDVRIDTHDADVPPAVWTLYEEAVRRFPEAGVVVERDDALPPFARLVAEVDCARRRHAAALARGPATPAVPPVPAAPASGAAASARPAAASWRATRRAFWRRLVDEPLGLDHGRDAALRALLDDARPVSAARGMRVYRDAYAATVRRALATNFPTLACVLGAADFDRLAAAYARRHPPRPHDVRGLGRHLARFLASFPLRAPYAVGAGVLAELAALEQAQLEVLDAADEPRALAPAALAAIPPARWDGARFRFSAALRVVRTIHDVRPAVRAVVRGMPPPPPAARPGAYLVCRGPGGVRVDRLEPRAAAILDALRRGDAFAAACAAAARRYPAAAAVVARAGARLLVGLARRGLVRAVRLRPARPRRSTAPRASVRDA